MIKRIKDYMEQIESLRVNVVDPFARIGDVYYGWQVSGTYQGKPFSGQFSVDGDICPSLQVIQRSIEEAQRKNFEMSANFRSQGRHEVALFLWSNDVSETPTKQCKKCQRWLPMTREFFFANTNNKDGLQFRCKECGGHKFGRYAKYDTPPATQSGYKRCTVCLEEFPAKDEYFHHSKNSKDGLSSTCKPCAIARASQNWRKDHPEPIHYDIPSGHKRCCNGDQCTHPLGAIQPATSEYFHKDKGKRDGLASRCKACAIARTRKWEQDNPERKRANGRKQYHKDIDATRAHAAEYRDEHRYQIRAGHKKWRDEHIEHVRAKSRQWKLANPEKVREGQQRRRAKDPHKFTLIARRWRKNNPEKDKANTQRRLARKRGLPNTLTGKEWQRAKTYFNHRCAACGRVTDGVITISADHWIPLSDPRPDNPGTVATNIVPLCKGRGGCNNSKGNKDAFTWLVQRYGNEEASEIVASIEAFFAWVLTQ